jgi:hypothetical protein
VGDGTIERTVALTNLSASSEVDCRYLAPTTNVNNILSPLVHVNRNEYWQINKISGCSGQIQLNWDNSKVAFPNVLLADVRVARYTSDNWTDAGGTATGIVTTTGQITSDPLSSFGALTFGYASTVLPVSHLRFTAERKSDHSLLKWITANEYLSERYDVQRSDAVTFYTIGNLRSNNNSTASYQYQDYRPLQGKAYYRLRLVDVDGQFTYSKAVLVRVQAPHSSLLY